jgi:hypothetical protein
LEDDLLASRLESFHDYGGGGEGSVTAELYFDRRCEPPQTMSRTVNDEEGRLGEIVLGRDRLQRSRGQELLEDDDGCRVPRESRRREGIELEDGCTHGRP